MLTFLDLLVVVFMVIAALSLLALCLMFMTKNHTIKSICFYVVVAIGIYLGYVGARISWPGFILQVAVAILMAVVSIAALILERRSKGDEKKLKIARIMASLALVIGMVNAFFL